MNQKRNFAERTEFSLFSRSNIARFLSSILLLVLMTTPNIALAQGNFNPSENSRSSYGQWTPPSSQPFGVDQVSGEQARPSLPEGFGFPDTAVAFDPSVRMAEHQVPVPNLNDGHGVESTIESTAEMFANLKDTTSEKLSGLAATFERDGGVVEKVTSLFGSTDISRMLGSLTLVLGIYFAFVWVMRKINPAANAGLPPEVIEVMGQVPFGPKRNLQLVRLGSKLLLLMNSPEGTQPIGEITDPVEVEYLTSICPGKRKTGSRSLAAIQNAAARIANARPTPAPVPNPAPAPAAAPNPTTQSNLANILRTLDQATKQGSAIFEA
jgi:flagellar biogenesis protein FliO